MATPSTVFAASPRMPVPGALPGRALRSAPVHPLARFAFWTIFLLSITNAIGFYIALMKRIHGEEYELSVYPVIFAVCTVIVLAFSKGKQRSTLLIVAGMFWLVYFLGGFLGSMQITTANFTMAVRLTLKPWMAIVGLPWLALRAISEDKVPRLMHITIVVTCFGAALGVLQVASPGFMEGLLANVGRAEGLWANPATSGYICSMVLFLSLMHPFKSRLLNGATRLMLLVGVGASLSRGPLLALLVAWVVYAVSARRFATLVKSIFGLILFLATSVAVLGTMEAISKHHEQRVSTVRSMLSGDWKAGTFADRTQIWGPAIDTILSNGGLLFGLGHGSMSNIVDQGSYGISPHNYYIYVLGNSGLFALMALLAFHFAVFQQGFRFAEREKRAAIFAISSFWMLAHMVDNAMVGNPAVSAIFTCVVVALAYARPQQPVRRQTLRPIYNGSMPPRAR